MEEKRNKKKLKKLIKKLKIVVETFGRMTGLEPSPQE